MSKPSILLGAGRHTKVLLDILLDQACEIIGILDPDEKKIGTDIFGIPVIGKDEYITHFSPDEVDLINGVGSIKSMVLRKKIYERFKKQGYHFRNVIHDSAIVSPRTQLGEGIQIMAGAIICADVEIGNDSIVNTKANISCESRIGCHVHIAPGCVISGGVHVADDVHVGTGSVVMQSLHIGEKALVGAGAVVIRDLLPGKTYVGVPAREVD